MSDTDTTVVAGYLTDLSKLFKGSEAKDLAILSDEFSQHLDDAFKEFPGLTRKGLEERFGSPKETARNLRKAYRLEGGYPPFPWARVIGLLVGFGVILVLIFRVTMT